MALYNYEIPATAISMVGADGIAQVFTGPEVTLDEMNPDTALNVFGGLVVYKEEFPDIPMTASGTALTNDRFVDLPMGLEMEFV